MRRKVSGMQMVGAEKGGKWSLRSMMHIVNWMCGALLSCSRRAFFLKELIDHADQHIKRGARPRIVRQAGLDQGLGRECVQASEDGARTLGRLLEAAALQQPAPCRRPCKATHRHACVCALWQRQLLLQRHLAMEDLGGALAAPGVHTGSHLSSAVRRKRGRAIGGAAAAPSQPMQSI